MDVTKPRSPAPLLLALALVLAAPVGTAILIGVAGLLSPDGDWFLPTLDALPVPEDWEAVHTEVVAGGFMTSARATRYYFADLLPVEGVSDVKELVRAAGFIDHPRPTVEENCRSNNGGLPTDCIVKAIRDVPSDDGRVEQLWINLDPPGSSFTTGSGDERMYVSDPDRALTRITVNAISLTSLD